MQKAGDDKLTSLNINGERDVTRHIEDRTPFLTTTACILIGIIAIRGFYAVRTPVIE
jgi:hypothetical protein